MGLVVAISKLGVVATIGTGALVVGLVLLLIARAFSDIRAEPAARDRCSFCRSRLKKMAGGQGYAPACSKCGRTQPWAQA